ncbi:MAG: uncharacterized protein KVP18_003821 [Porospora cf. gigantea A]|nr:MAG: hypothetical protein KVP18_003821 [Porospora cf. gigantea A]
MVVSDDKSYEIAIVLLAANPLAITVVTAFAIPAFVPFAVYVMAILGLQGWWLALVSVGLGMLIPLCLIITHIIPVVCRV